MTLIRVHPDELLRDAMKKSVSDCRHFGRSFSEVKWHCLWHVLCILLQYALPCAAGHAGIHRTLSVIGLTFCRM